MYVRPSNTGARSIKLPENYSGNAFSSHSHYSDMPPPARMMQPKSDIPFEGNMREADNTPDHMEIRHDTTEAVGAGEEKNSVSESKSVPVSSLFSTLLPHTDISKHFPFGHGIGSEELLILAVMLMVFLSGNDQCEVDSEFLLLLGLLLFAG